MGSGRIYIFVISILLGVCGGGMWKGTWPGYSGEWSAGGAAAGREGGVSDEIMVLAGVTSVAGPGIRVTVEDSASSGKSIPPERLLVHERHLMLLTNELFAAGAEALAVNGHRFVATTEIRCAGPVISIDGTDNVPPYVVEAIGDPEVLKQSVMMMGGVVDVLALDNLHVGVETEARMAVPAHRKKKTFGKVVVEK